MNGVAQVIKNLPAIQETWASSLGWEDPLEKGKATHSSILAWRIPWTEEPCGLRWQSQSLLTANTFTFTTVVKVKSLSRVRLFAHLCFLQFNCDSIMSNLTLSTTVFNISCPQDVIDHGSTAM